MSKNNITKVGVAVILLAIVLIFLGVNYVPQIYALSSSQKIGVDAVKLVRSDYVDEQYPRAIMPQPSFQSNTANSVILVRSDYIDEQYPRAILPQPSFQSNTAANAKLVRPDYFDEHYPRAIMP